MITLDIFTNDAFSVVTMLPAVNKMPTVPGFLGSLNMFESKPVSTDTVGIGMKQGQLAIIRTTLRGAPIEAAGPKVKNVRPFKIPRYAKGDKLYAAELANTLPDPGVTEVDTVASVLAEKQQDLKQDVEYTLEFARHGTVQGVLLDEDGSTLVDYWAEWGLSEPAEVELDLPSAVDGELRTSITSLIHRPLIRAAQAGTAIRRVIGLAGDEFWDALIQNKEVRETYLNWSAAADLREAKPFETFRYGGVDWINYQGSDNEDIRIDDEDAVIFPVGVPGMFQDVKGPGETFETVNRMGKDVYPLIVRDKDRDMWVQPEIYAYRLQVNTRPDLILRATIGS